MEQQNETEFLSLIGTYNKIIYKICYMYATDDENLKDLYQETVINLWKGYKDFIGLSKMSSWIYRVCLNTCISYYRQDKKHRETLTLSDQHDIEDNNEHAEQIKELYQLINRLNKLEKAIILMWLDEKSYEEIAEIIGINRNAVASRIKRIKEKLSKLSNE